MFLEKINLNTVLYIYFSSISLFSFILIAIDKKRAINHKWRIRESTLLFFSFIGGAIGTFIGMTTFRHKTKKKKFSIGVPVLVLFNIFIFVLFLI